MAREAVAAFAPGRINLIGEHTDYNGGLALPFAIAAGRHRARHGDRRAADRGTGRSTSAKRTRSSWPRRRAMPRAGAPSCAASPPSSQPPGCRWPVPAWRSAARCRRAPGCRRRRRSRWRWRWRCSSLPGAAPPDGRALARLCSRVENQWVGAHTGLLDQLATHLRPAPTRRCGSTFTRWRSSRWRSTSTAGGWVTLDSGERHALAGSGYNRAPRRVRPRLRGARDREPARCRARAGGGPAFAARRSASST